MNIPRRVAKSLLQKHLAPLHRDDKVLLSKLKTLASSNIEKIDHRKWQIKITSKNMKKRYVYGSFWMGLHQPSCIKIKSCV